MGVARTGGRKYDANFPTESVADLWICGPLVGGGGGEYFLLLLSMCTLNKIKNWNVAPLTHGSATEYDSEILKIWLFLFYPFIYCQFEYLFKRVSLN